MQAHLPALQRLACDGPVAPVRQLRTTAAPAIAVEISSVSVEDRADLDRMTPGLPRPLRTAWSRSVRPTSFPFCPETGGEAVSRSGERGW